MPSLSDIRKRIFGPSRSEMRADFDQRMERMELQVEQARDRAYRMGVASGVDMTFGQFGYETNTDLRGSTRWETYAKMEADPHVKAALRSNMLPLMLADWEYVPASDKAVDIEAAELCNANLLCQADNRYGEKFYLQTSWLQRLFEILDMLRSGFSMFAYTMRPQGSKIVYDRLQWLEPDSVDPYGWEIDDQDNILRVNRTYKDATDRYRYKDPIEADRLVLYPWELKGARFEGNPFIRAMYGAWYRKEHYLRWAAIGGQRFAAPMPIISYPSEFKNTEGLVDLVEEVAKASRGTSPDLGFGMFPRASDGGKVEVDFPASKVEQVDRMRSMIDGENAEISHGGAIKSQLLGETSSGSRALGESIKGEEMPLRQAVALIICDYENRGVGNLLGIANRLVKLNFANANTPMLTVRNLDHNERLDNYALKISAWKAGIIPKDPDARRQMCEPLDLELPDEAYDVQPPPDLPSPPIQKQNKGEQPEEPDGKAAVASVSLGSVEDFRKRIEPLLKPVQEGRPSGGGFRYPTVLESKFCNLAAVQVSYRDGEQDIKTALRRIRQDMIGDLMGRLRNGKISKRNIESQRRSKFRQFKRSQSVLAAELDRVGERGMDHAKDEIKKQGRQ